MRRLAAAHPDSEVYVSIGDGEHASVTATSFGYQVGSGPEGRVLVVEEEPSEEDVQWALEQGQVDEATVRRAFILK